MIITGADTTDSSQKEETAIPVNSDDTIYTSWKSTWNMMNDLLRGFFNDNTQPPNSPIINRTTTM
jgi:hypothetical protein